MAAIWLPFVDVQPPYKRRRADTPFDIYYVVSRRSNIHLDRGSETYAIVLLFAQKDIHERKRKGRREERRTEEEAENESRICPLATPAACIAFLPAMSQPCLHYATLASASLTALLGDASGPVSITPDK